ncbi:protein kinase [Candidatus Saganbacteria bacterium]|nr:protein kinase [Candidatus Saganbacteria bacterium]
MMSGLRVIEGTSGVRGSAGISRIDSLLSRLRAIPPAAREGQKALLQGLASTVNQALGNRQVAAALNESTIKYALDFISAVNHDEYREAIADAICFFEELKHEPESLRRTIESSGLFSGIVVPTSYIPERVVPESTVIVDPSAYIPEGTASALTPLTNDTLPSIILDPSICTDSIIIDPEIIMDVRGSIDPRLEMAIPRNKELFAAPPVPPSPGSLVAGRYQVGRLLAEGGCSRVYECLDITSDSDQRLVIKVDTGQNLIRQEAEDYRCLNDKQVAGVPRLVSAGTNWLILDYIAGDSLTAFKQARYYDRLPTMLPRQAAIAYMVDVFTVINNLLFCLQKIHSLGIVHNDICSQNVKWLPDEGLPIFLFDFGAARRITDASRREAIGLREQFAAPERLQEGFLRTNSDIFSVGCVAYHLITGEYPFVYPEDRSEKTLEFFYAQIRNNRRKGRAFGQSREDILKQLSPLKAVGKAVTNFLFTLTAFDPNKRLGAAAAGRLAENILIKLEQLSSCENTPKVSISDYQKAV